MIQQDLTWTCTQGSTQGMKNSYLHRGVMVMEVWEELPFLSSFNLQASSKTRGLGDKNQKPSKNASK